MTDITFEQIQAAKWVLNNSEIEYPIHVWFNGETYKIEESDMKKPSKGTKGKPTKGGKSC